MVTRSRLVADIWLRRRHHNMRLTVVVCLPAHLEKPAYCWRAFRCRTEDASGMRKYRTVKCRPDFFLFANKPGAK
jgi:hypothetical protein